MASHLLARYRLPSNPAIAALTLTQIVSRDSAVLVNQHDIAHDQSLNANHMDMAKIEDRKDEKFKRIWTPIGEVLDTLSSRTVAADMRATEVHSQSHVR